LVTQFERILPTPQRNSFEVKKACYSRENPPKHIKSANKKKKYEILKGLKTQLAHRK